jgi:hypothetical protein
VAFHVLSTILAEASDVFHDMVSLGSAHLLSIRAVGQDQAPSVDLAEDANTLDMLLRFLYPIRRPQIALQYQSPDDALDVIVTLLKAADKYQIDCVTWGLREQLLHPSLLKHRPIRVYTIACMFGFEEEARIASSHTLNVNVLETPLFGELGLISARDYLRLVQLHQKRALSAVSILQTATPTCVGCSKERDAGPLWWCEFKDRATKELKQKPSTDTIFGASFLANCVTEAKGLCPHCPLSYLSVATQARLEHMKEKIDALPRTVESFR